MMTMLTVQLSAWSMLVLTGLWTGMCLCYAVDRLSAWRRMPLEQFTADFRHSQFRADPLQPVLAISAMVAAAVFAFYGAGYARILTCIGITLILCVVIASITIGEPINRKFRRSPEGSVPMGADADRTSWTRFHRIRTVLAFAAFGSLAAAGVVGLR